MENKKGIVFIGLRYLILLVLAAFNLAIFYIILAPLTIYPFSWLLGIFYEVSITGNIVQFNGFSANIISSCVAGSAYYLLLILNLTTPMSIRKRLKSIIFLFTTFLGLNIIRILVFALLLSSGYAYFDLTHKMTWYLGSTLFVLLIWLANIKIYRIKNIPVYTDIKRIMRKP